MLRGRVGEVIKDVLGEGDLKEGGWGYEGEEVGNWWMGG